MSRIGVVVIDDSAVMRRILTEALSQDPALAVVGTAGDAASALAKIAETSPHIVTLDVEMPGRSGLDLLVDIRRLAPRLPVIMFSASTTRAAATTLEALARGATDYVTKPSGTTREAAIELVRAQLIPKLKLLGHSIPVMCPKQMKEVMRPRGNGAASLPAELLVVGASTGGPNALCELFRGLPADFPIPIAVVQHMPPMFTRLLAERLDASCPLSFAEATHGAALVPGHVLVAPGDSHMRVVKGPNGLAVTLDKEPPENSCRPAVDVLFRAAAATGARTLGVVLTGMGQDGLRGCEAIRARNGQVVVQDEATSVVWGMPGFIARAGIADRILPLLEIANEIMQRVGTPRVRLGVPGVA